MNKRGGGIPCISEKDGQSSCRAQHGKKMKRKVGGKDRAKHGKLKNTGRKRIKRKIE